MSEPTASQHLEAMQERAYHGGTTDPLAKAALERVSVAVAALEAIRDRHTESYEAMTHEGPLRYCHLCDCLSPCPDHEHAVRALDALRNAS